MFNSAAGRIQRRKSAAIVPMLELHDAKDWNEHASHLVPSRLVEVAVPLCSNDINIPRKSHRLQLLYFPRCQLLSSISLANLVSPQAQFSIVKHLQQTYLSHRGDTVCHSQCDLAWSTGETAGNIYKASDHPIRL